MKSYHILLIALLFVVCSCSGPHDPALERLNDEIAHRPQYFKEKEERISKLKKQLSASGVSDERRILIYDELYDEYATFQFDSALNVVNDMHILALECNDEVALYKSNLRKIMLYATAGYFSELNAMIESLPRQIPSPELKPEYYKTMEWAYNRTADFLNDGSTAEEYFGLGARYQDSVMQALPKESLEYHYYNGHKIWHNNDVDSIIREFQYVADNVDEDDRLYAQATYMLSCLYNRIGDFDNQKEYLAKAAISDQKGQLKESVALQELALFLKENGGDKSLANNYLSLAMEDARFYGNRLRLLQMAYKYPEITTDYEQQLIEAHNRQVFILIIVAVLMVLLCITVILLAKYNKKIHRERRQIEITRDELKSINEQNEVTNQQLQQTNVQLREQTRLRENCITLFMELTAAYINKLNVFHLIVRTKVKSNQTAELLKLANPSRMSEPETKEFFMNFDSTFLSTFPNFIENINSLLRPEERFTDLDLNTLTLDLRILALMRLGVKDSAKIAMLLNCSPQTIYNHRSQVKAKAISKSDFDKDILNA